MYNALCIVPNNKYIVTRQTTMSNYIVRYIDKGINKIVGSKINKTNNINNTDNVSNTCESLSMPRISDTPDTLVLSGGAFKGIAQLGALYRLTKEKLLDNIKVLAATSVGSLIGFLLIIGFNPKELYIFFTKLDYSLTTDISLSNIIDNYGLDTGSNIMYVIKKLCKTKGISRKITFKELYECFDKDFIVTGVSVNDKTVHYFNKDTHPNMKVLDALRISMSVPILFSPVPYDNKLFIDGGCMDNYPIHLFKNKPNNVIGIYVSQMRHSVDKIDSIETYIRETMQCMYEGIAYNYGKHFTENTVYIPCENVSITSANTEAVHRFFKHGYQCADKYINEIINHQHSS